MALTETPLTMANAVHAFAGLDTNRQARMLVQQGQNYSTEDLVARLRAAHPATWAALVLALRDTNWADHVAELAPAARHVLGVAA